jgi:hypothetical protein
VVYAPDEDGLVARFRALRVGLPDETAVFAGGAGVRRLGDRLERVGVRCPAGVGELREALERQAAG